MEFKLARQETPQILLQFATKKVRQNKIVVPRATRKNLSQIEKISREIEKSGLPDHLVLKKLKGKIGHGIFLHPSSKPILKGDVIAPYSGEVYLAPQNQGEGSDYAFSLISDLLLTKKEQLLLDSQNRYHPRRLYSLDLDAHKKGNFTRFINHSDKPNIEAQFLRIPTESGISFEIIYVARKTIRPSEQLLVCYDDEDKCYWGAMKIKPFSMTPKTFQLNHSLEVVTNT